MSRFRLTSTLSKATTDTLEIAFLHAGERQERVALLLHGWPDDATTWNSVAERLAGAGIRVIMPWLRGFGPTRFHSASTSRDGRTEALAPERLETITAISLGYSPRGAFPIPTFEQSRAWWYQWFMSVDRGAEAMAKDPKGFARIQWQTWSPKDWFDDATFEAVAQSFENPDWLAITLSSYRRRWRDEPRDPRYDALHEKIPSKEHLSIPTLMIQGGADQCVLAESTAGKDEYFSGPYRRIVLDGVGHFPTREAPNAVADAVLEHLS